MSQEQAIPEWVQQARKQSFRLWIERIIMQCSISFLVVAGLKNYWIAWPLIVAIIVVWIFRIVYFFTFELQVDNPKLRDHQERIRKTFALIPFVFKEPLAHAMLTSQTAILREKREDLVADTKLTTANLPLWYRYQRRVITWSCTIAVFIATFYLLPQAQ